MLRDDSKRGSKNNMGHSPPPEKKDSQQVDRLAEQRIREQDANVVNAEFVADQAKPKIGRRDDQPPTWTVRIIAASSSAIILTGVAAMGGMVWLLMATFASDGHSGELPDAMMLVFAAELLVGAVMIIAPPVLILLGYRWQTVLISTIGIVAFAVAASFALFFACILLMSR